jgi:hypothetical protein
MANCYVALQIGHEFLATPLPDCRVLWTLVMKQIWRPKSRASAAGRVHPCAAENPGGANRGRRGGGSANDQDLGK